MQAVYLGGDLRKHSGENETENDEKPLKGCLTEVTAIGSRGSILHLFSPLNYENVKITLVGRLRQGSLLEAELCITADRLKELRDKLITSIPLG